MYSTSIFQSGRVHDRGSNVLVNQRSCNCLCKSNDLQDSSGKRASHTVYFGIAEDTQDSRAAYLYGEALSSTPNASVCKAYRMTLPVFVLGSLQERLYLLAG